MDEELSPEEEELWGITQDFYVALDKLVRGIQLYQGKGGLVERLLSDLMKRAEKMLQRKDSTVKITPIGPIFLEKPIFEDGKSSKYIFQMYRDGVRELTFQQGLDIDEMRTFATVCNADIAAIDDDIVTLMWKADFGSIQYYAVDSLGEQETVESDLLEQNDDGIVSMEDGEQSQFSSSDMRLLRSKDSVNWVQMCAAPTQPTADLAQMIENIDKAWPQEREFDRFLAIIVQLSRSGSTEISMIESIFSSMALNGNVTAVNGILGGLNSLVENQVPEAGELLSSLLSVDGIEVLKDIFEQNANDFKPILTKLVTLANFQADGLVELLQHLPLGDSRSTLQEILLHSSVDMTRYYVQGLQDEDEAIVLESLDALGKIDSEDSLRALYSSLGHSLTAIRARALSAINGRYLAGQAKSLGKVLKDPDDSNRLLALEICHKIIDKEVGNIILGVMQEVGFTRRPMDEQQQFYQILHKYPFPTTFQFLSLILKDKNIVRNKSIAARQLWAVEVFAEMGTEDAKSILQGLKGNWFLPADVKQRIKQVI